MYVKRIKMDEKLKDAFDIRKQVFVIEQGVPLAMEFDQFYTLNGLCEHIIIYFNEQPVGAGRVRIVDNIGKLERICILFTYRKFGLGKMIIKALEEIVKEQGVSGVKLHGQKQAEGFYQKLGYCSSSEVFMEDGIPHILMQKELVTT